MPGKNYLELISTPQEGYEILALAVIEEVCRDYRSALVTRDAQKIHSCEHFFKGPQFAVYSQGKIDPDYMIDKIRSEVYGC